MFIGSMRLVVERQYDSFISEYQVKILLEDDTLMPTLEKSSRENVLYELVIFKEEFDDNERTLVSFCLSYLFNLIEFSNKNISQKLNKL